MSKPLPFFLLPLHVVEHPVPDDKEAGDDDVGKQPCAEEGEGDGNFGFHDGSPLLYASSGTVSTPAASSSFRTSSATSRSSLGMKSALRWITVTWEPKPAYMEANSRPM